MTEAPPPPGDDSSPGSTPPPAAPPPPPGPPTPPPPVAPTPPPPPPAAPTPPPPATPPASPGGFPPPPPPPPDPAAGGYGGPPPPAPYGAAPPPGAGYGYGQPQGYGAPAPGGAYASWGLRVQAALVDWFGPTFVAEVIYFAINRAFGSLLLLVALAWALFQAYQAGATGQSLGKKMAGIRLLNEKTGQPIGGGLGIGRYFLHILDSIPCVPVGLLWPLWDAKKQTFADKILTTIVIKT
jgi:uncharacterized RDD family membrane protein YckC